MLKVIKWLSVAIVTPWLMFMLVSIFSGGEVFTRMGDSLASSVQGITLKLSTKADMIKRQADEWREKITGKKSEVREAEEAKPKAEKPKEKKAGSRKQAMLNE